MKKLSKREKLLIVILIIVIIVFGLGNFVVKPYLEKISDLKAQKDKLDEQKFEMSINISQYSLAEENRISADEKLDKLLAQYPELKTNTQIDSIFRQKANDYNITIDSFNMHDISLEDTDDNDDFSETTEAVSVGIGDLLKAIGIDVSLSGSITDVNDFISSFENDIYSINMLDMSQNDGTATLKAEFNVIMRR